MMIVIYWLYLQETPVNMPASCWEFSSSHMNYNQAYFHPDSRTVISSQNWTKNGLIFWTVSGLFLFIDEGFRILREVWINWVSNFFVCVVEAVRVRYRIAKYSYDSFYKERLQSTLAACVYNSGRRKLKQQENQETTQTTEQQTTAMARQQTPPITREWLTGMFHLIPFFRLPGSFRDSIRFHWQVSNIWFLSYFL